MKFLSNLSITLIFLSIYSFSNAQNAKPAAAPKAVSVLKNNMDSLSYAIGLNIAESLKSQKLSVNANMLAMAINDVKLNKKTIMSNVDGGSFVRAYFDKQASQGGAENKKKGEAFLAKNKTAEGVKTTASGLQYKVLKEGDGAKPTATDKVKVHYHGTTIDGKVFDSSVDRGEPISFPLNGVIKGWTEGLQLMPLGSKYTFYIPSNLAYGLQGPPNIGPNQVLIFDVELLGIEK